MRRASPAQHPTHRRDHVLEILVRDVAVILRARQSEESEDVK
jgi:hypothetical protein